MKTCGTCVHFTARPGAQEHEANGYNQPGDCTAPFPASLSVDHAAEVYMVDGVADMDCPCWAVQTGPLPSIPRGSASNVPIAHLRETTLGATPTGQPMKHPGPWRDDSYCVVDANGRSVFSGGSVGLDNAEIGWGGEEDEGRRLVLASPVLLEALSVATSENCPRDITPFNLLIGWLNGEPGYPEINMEEFLKWLRGERTTLIITRETVNSTGKEGT